MKTWLRRLLPVVVGLVAVGYLLLRLQTRWEFDKSQCDRQLMVIRMAIDQMKQDRQLLANCLQKVTKNTLGKNKSKDEEISRLLENPDLNRLALIYTGSDWSAARSKFLGKVNSDRTKIGRLTSVIDQRRSLVEKRIKYLKNRRDSLKTQLTEPSKVLARRDELNEVERQLALLQSETGVRTYLKSDDASREATEEIIRIEKEIYTAAEECWQATVDDLMRILEMKIAQGERREAYYELVGRSSSVFDIVTLRRLFVIWEDDL